MINKQEKINGKMKILNGIVFAFLIIGIFAFASVIAMPQVSAEEFGNCLTDYIFYGYDSPDEYCADWYGGGGDGKCIDSIGQCASCEDAGIPEGYALNDEVWLDGGTSGGTCMWCNNGEVVADPTPEDCDSDSCTADEYFTNDDGECLLCSSDGTSSDPADQAICDYGCDDDSTCMFGEYCDLESPIGQFAGQCTEGCNELDSNCDGSDGSTTAACGADGSCGPCESDSQCNSGTCNDGVCGGSGNGCYWEGVDYNNGDSAPTSCSYMGYSSEGTYDSICLGNDEWDDSAASYSCSDCSEGETQEYACDGSEGTDYTWAVCTDGQWDSSGGYGEYTASCENNGCDWEGQTFPEGDYPGIDCGDGSGNTYSAVCTAGEWDWDDYYNNCVSGECEWEGTMYPEQDYPATCEDGYTPYVDTCSNGVWSSDYDQVCVGSGGCEWEGTMYPEQDYPATCEDGYTPYVDTCSNGVWSSDYDQVCVGSGEDQCYINGVWDYDCLCEVDSSYCGGDSGDVCDTNSYAYDECACDYPDDYYCCSVGWTDPDYC